MARPINTTRKLTRNGNSSSLSVVIPAEFLRAFGWHERQRLLLTKVAGGVLVKDARSKKKKIK
jgi:bifunctional DNA-binding transcriptional regulator/antitoxin component of YhaV-PrlF toxin-antitoxin module